MTALHRHGPRTAAQAAWHVGGSSRELACAVKGATVVASNVALTEGSRPRHFP